MPGLVTDHSLPYADQSHLCRPSIRKSNALPRLDQPTLGSSPGRHGRGKSRREPHEWIAVAPVPALVNPAQFEQAAERLMDNRQMARRNNQAHDYLLRGLVSCGHCRYGCVGRQQKGNYDYYVCRTTAGLRAIGVRCPARFIPATALDDLAGSAPVARDA
jgi:Recombinase zinc beta ribbon domain